MVEISAEMRLGSLLLFSSSDLWGSSFFVCLCSLFGVCVCVRGV